MILLSLISLAKIKKSKTDRIQRNELSNILLLGVCINVLLLENNLAISQIRKKTPYNFNTIIPQLGVYPLIKSILCSNKFSLLLRYNSHSIHIHFKVYILVGFNIFTKLCKRHPSLSNSRTNSSPQKESLYSLTVIYYFLLSPGPGNL